MKILEAQSAQLTNYEVYKHLIEQKERHAKLQKLEKKGRRPGNLETIVKELLDYFQEAPSPLGSTPFPYNENTIRTLLQKLREFEFTKAEIIMILNLRPTKPENLNTIVEEMEDRYPSDEQQQKIVDLIAEVLGTPDGVAEMQAMKENAKEARQEQMDQAVRDQEQIDSMETG